MPEHSWQDLVGRDSLVDVSKNELGLFFTFTSPKRFNQVFTHGNKKYDGLQQYLLRAARGDSVVRGLTRTVLANRTLPNYLRAGLWVKIEMPAGGNNPFRQDIVHQPDLTNYVTRQEFNDFQLAVGDSLRDHRTMLTKHDLQLAEDKQRLDELKHRRPGEFLTGDFGASVFGGYFTGTFNKLSYNCPTVGLAGRFMDFKVEGFLGDLGNWSQQPDTIGNNIYTAFKNNHIEGGYVGWAPLQGHNYQFGKFWSLGVTAIHAHNSDLQNFANNETFYGGPAGEFAIPLPFITPEVWVTAGYSRTKTLPTATTSNPNLIPKTSEGFGAAVRFTAVIGHH